MNRVRTRKNITDPITHLKSHVRWLEKQTKNYPKYNGYDVEFYFIEKTSQLPEYKNIATKSADMIENKEKNRYPDVKPYDETRVKLCEKIFDDGTVEPGSDFINASFIKGPNGPKSYISAQGPTSSTLHDFWRMIWQHNIYVFVMLTREIESNKEKCTRYWPDKEKGSVTYKEFVVTLEDESLDPELTQRTLQVVNTTLQQSRTITHLQYTEWPDHGLPTSTAAFLSMVNIVDDLISKSPKGPIGVHCSAGIGRSGTFCTVHKNLHDMRNYFKEKGKLPQLNIVNSILDIRKQRPGMVQTNHQFTFCYRALLDEYIRLKAQAKKI